MDPNILVTICARGGSKGVKGKNIRLLSGKPLISYTICQGLRWGKARHLIVSTDSDEIAEVARTFGAKVPFIRPRELATDHAPKLLAIRHALKMCEELYNKRFDTVIDLDPTSPIRTKEDIENAYQIFLRSKTDVVTSVTPARRNPYFNMLERNKRGKVTVSKYGKHPVYRRQDAPLVYDMNASIYIFKRDFIQNNKNRSVTQGSKEIYVMDELSSMDIDREIDFQFIEFLIKRHIIRL